MEQNRASESTERRGRTRRAPVFVRTAIVVAVGLAGAVGLSGCGSATSTVGELDFANPLQIPPLAEPTRDGDRLVYDLEFQAGGTQFLDGEPTRTWGLNGSYLGPTLRAARGDKVTVNVTNGLDETTTLHWHGMHLPPGEDGGPHQMIQAGDTWSPSWSINQPAATLWFHPHMHGRTAEHVFRGAAGMFIVDDPEITLDLPDTYGVDDIPVIVQDRSFDGDNQFTRREPSNTGLLGEEILINGTHNPHFRVTTELIRLRVLNASNGRLYNLQFEDRRPFQLIGTDGGLMSAPAELTDLLLSPGERVELIVAMEPGEHAVLQSVKPDMGVGSFADRDNGSQDSFDLLQLSAADDLKPSPPLPDRLVQIDAPEQSESVDTRQFELGNDTINGDEMDMGRIDLVVQDGTVEIWEITNDHGRPHSFHPHLIHFLILDVDGNPPPLHLTGWKDTVYVPPGQTIRVIARFDGYPDPDRPYMYHCHILQHEDDGMMGQFVVIDADTTAPDRIDPGEHGH